MSKENWFHYLAYSFGYALAGILPYYVLMALVIKAPEMIPVFFMVVSFLVGISASREARKHFEDVSGNK